jgi:hypothetical protein
MEWATYNRGRALTPRQLAKQLDIYGIKPKTVRQSDNKTPKGYEKAQFEDAFTRYLKPTTTPSAPAVAAHSPGSPAPEVAATAQRNLTNLDTFDIDAEMGRGGVADTGTPPPLDEMY